MDTFTWMPDYEGTELQEEPRILEAKFGDGYAQRLGDGINNNAPVLPLTFTNIDVTTANAIVAFFRAHGGTTPFLWTPPDETGTWQWVCKKWSKRYTGFGTRTLTAEFTRDFAP